MMKKFPSDVSRTEYITFYCLQKTKPHASDAAGKNYSLFTINNQLEHVLCCTVRREYTIVRID